MELLTRRLLNVKDMVDSRVKFPSLEGVGVGFWKKLIFIKSQIIAAHIKRPLNSSKRYCF